MDYQLIGSFKDQIFGLVFLKFDLEKLSSLIKKDFSSKFFCRKYLLLLVYENKCTKKVKSFEIIFNFLFYFLAHCNVKYQQSSFLKNITWIMQCCSSGLPNQRVCSLCLIFTILVSFSQGNTLFASEAKINIF